MNQTTQPNRREFLRLAGSGIMGSVLAGVVRAEESRVTEVCVYGATASGVMAAVAAAREGARVILVEPSRWLGGMTGGGLIHIDWGREQAVGGSARVILKSQYNDPQFRAAFASMLEEHAIEVIFEHRVGSVEREGAVIRSVSFDHAPPDRFGCPVGPATRVGNKVVRASVYIDCSYEGDLMARSGVAYTFGREARTTYGESLAGVQEKMSVYPIDPYLIPGEPKSGLIPLLQEVTELPEGSADRLTMGYGFRWKFSKGPERLPIEPPEDFDPRTFELFRRGFQTQVNLFAGRQIKHQLDRWEVTGSNFYGIGAGNLSRALWAPTNFGSNADYPDGDYATRARIWKGQLDFVRGMTHFLRTDPSVPAKYKNEAMDIGLEAGIFDETSGYPHQLYVREARRMKSAYVVTQKDLLGESDPGDSVGLASYGVDEWPYATSAFEGKVALHGGYYSMVYLEESHRGIYKIPYRSITPLKRECENLLVPICLSASHIAMTSIRMEPVWMGLGESAGVAAALAIKTKVPVQEVDYALLREKLLSLNQRLERPI